MCHIVHPKIFFQHVAYSSHFSPSKSSLFFHFIQFKWQNELCSSQGWQPVYHKKKIMAAYCWNSSAKSIINQKDISAQACHLRKEATIFICSIGSGYRKVPQRIQKIKIRIILLRDYTIIPERCCTIIESQTKNTLMMEQ